MEIIFATGNPHKASEASQVLGEDITLIMPKELGMTEEIPETGNTLEENAIQKCRYLWEKTGRDCFADDTGLEVQALGNAPGVHTARYVGDNKDPRANMDKLLAELALRPQLPRTARFRTVVALMLGGTLHTFEGVLNGTIAREKAGAQGFGYDPVFIPEGYDKTLAEISASEKNAISHRGISMRKLASFLRSQSASATPAGADAGGLPHAAGSASGRTDGGQHP